MNLTEVLKALYASEINCGIESFYDGGWSAWIRDPKDAVWFPERGLRTLEEVAAWLDQEARKRYPKSEYAKQPPPLF